MIYQKRKSAVGDMYSLLFCLTSSWKNYWDKKKWNKKYRLNIAQRELKLKLKNFILQGL